MTLENYSPRYREDVVRLIKDFHSEYLRDFYGPATDEAIGNTIEAFSGDKAKNAFLLVVHGVCVGLLAGIEIPSKLNGGVFYQEVIWYVEPKYGHLGLRLLKAVENRLKCRGVNIIIMAVLENEKAAKLKSFYDRIGYRPMETHYMREL